jgi:nicotinamidase-related amidase
MSQKLLGLTHYDTVVCFFHYSQCKNLRRVTLRTISSSGTLTQLAGLFVAAMDPSDPRTVPTALLVIDVQKNFWTENELVRTAFPTFPENVANLLSVCRDSRSGIKLIVHVQAVYTEEGGSAWMPYFRALNPDKTDSAWNSPEEFAAPMVEQGTREEVVVEKPTFDAFLNTELEEILKKAGIQQTFFAGLVTSACVQASAHGAFARGFCPVLFEDCCADRTVEKHLACLNIYGGYMYKRSRVALLRKMLGMESSGE